MREIKFRWWNKFDCKMIDFEFCDIYGGKIEFGHLNFTIDTCDVMQFTGLKDKNGVEIYEGDIVSHGGYDQWEKKQTEVTFRDGRFETDGAWLSDYEEWDLEVIGNIHQNPELL